MKKLLRYSIVQREERKGDIERARGESSEREREGGRVRRERGESSERKRGEGEREGRKRERALLCFDL